MKTFGVILDEVSGKNISTDTCVNYNNIFVQASHVTQYLLRKYQEFKEKYEVQEMMNVSIINKNSELQSNFNT